MGIERDWTTEAGLRAVAIRHDGPGHLCGYVQVPSEHHLFGVDYDQKTANLPRDEHGDRTTPCDHLEVHGGLTYADDSIPLEEETSGWWFGFDCAHAGDATAYSRPGSGDVERSLDYVVGECESLAKQIKGGRLT